MRTRTENVTVVSEVGSIQRVIMAEASKEMEIQDDGTEYQDMEDEPTAP